jgi:hypothetical protein
MDLRGVKVFGLGTPHYYPPGPIWPGSGKGEGRKDRRYGPPHPGEAYLPIIPQARRPCLQGMYFHFKPGGIQLFWVLTIFPAMIIFSIRKKTSSLWNF